MKFSNNFPRKNCPHQPNHTQLTLASSHSHWNISYYLGCSLSKSTTHALQTTGISFATMLIIVTSNCPWQARQHYYTQYATFHERLRQYYRASTRKCRCCCPHDLLGCYVLMLIYWIEDKLEFFVCDLIYKLDRLRLIDLTWYGLTFKLKMQTYLSITWGLATIFKERIVVISLYDDHKQLSLASSHNHWNIWYYLGCSLSKINNTRTTNHRNRLPYNADCYIQLPLTSTSTPIYTVGKLWWEFVCSTAEHPLETAATAAPTTFSVATNVDHWIEDKLEFFICDIIYKLDWLPPLQKKDFTRG